MLQSQDQARPTPPVPKPAPHGTWGFGAGERSIAGELAACPQCGGNGMPPHQPTPVAPAA